MKITAWVHATKTIGVAITPERIENMKCPKCGKEVNRLLALSRADNKTMICNKCGTKEALDAAGLTEGSSIRKSILACVGRGSTPQERVRAKCKGIQIVEQTREQAEEYAKDLSAEEVYYDMLRKIVDAPTTLHMKCSVRMLIPIIDRKLRERGL